MKDLPKQTGLIFDTLSKGRFICADSNELAMREMHGVIETHSDPLSDFFEQIGFRLEQGDGYFYFSREEEKANIERKISVAFKWIDMLDFFTTFNNSFAPGFRFYTTQLQEQLRVNGLLRTRLQDMQSKGGDASGREQIDALLKSMEREGFIEKVDEFDQAWKVTAALHYAQQLVLALDIQDDEPE